MEDKSTKSTATEPTQDAPSMDIEAFSPLSPRTRGVILLTPVTVFLLSASIIYLLLGWRTFSFFLANAVGNFIGAGKFVILTGALPNAPLGVWPLAALVVYSDLSVALMVLAAIRVLYRMPLIGKQFAKVRTTGWRILKNHPWIRRAALWSVVVFVALPFQGTGSVLGTIIARMSGLSRVATVLAIGLGSALGCTAVALLGQVGRERMTVLVKQPFLGLAVVAALFIAMYIIGKRVAGDE
jgi:hypothetical protein